MLGFLFWVLQAGAGFSVFLLAQEAEPGGISGGVDTSDILESMVEEESATEEMAEDLEELMENPIDLNTASVEEIEELPGIDSVLAYRIVKLRQSLGQFSKWEQLYMVDGMTPQLLETIKKFAYIEKPEIQRKGILKSFMGQIRYRHLYSWKSPSTFEDYLLDYYPYPDKFYLQFKGRWGRVWTFGALLEKDPGERNYADNWKVSIVTKRKWWLFDQIAIGNYRLGIGQGLVLSHQAGMSLLPTVATKIRVKRKGLKLDVSSQENAYFRGFAFSTSFGPVQFTPFFSWNYYDATLNDDGTVKTLFPAVQMASVSHYNEKYEKRKDVLRDISFGLDTYISLGVANRVGFTVLRTLLDPPAGDPDPDDLYGFSGDEKTIVGMNWALYSSYLSFFGEAAKQIGYGGAFLSGLIADMGHMGGSILVRYYSPSYYNYHAGGFVTLQNVINNEKGITLGFSYKGGLESINILADYASEIWNSDTGYPRSKYKLIGILERNIAPKTLLQSKYTLTYVPSDEVKVVLFDEWGDEVSSSYDYEPTLTQGLRLQLVWEKGMRFRVRVEGKNWRELGGQYRTNWGFLTFLDVMYPVWKNFTLYARALNAYVQDYTTANIYEFENTLSGYMEIGSHSGVWYSWYILLKTKVSPLSVMNFKFSYTHVEPLKDVITESFSDRDYPYDLYKAYLQMDIKI